MPTAEEQRETARVKIVRYGQTETEPKLDSEDVESILDDAKRATIWTANTAYSYGDVILPTVRNGHAYRCIVAGASEASSVDEPEWPTLQNAQITEGVSDPLLTWQECGADFANLYNVRRAVHQAWMMKAGKASLSVDTTGTVGGLRAAQIFEHCVAQAEKYLSIEIG